MDTQETEEKVVCRAVEIVKADNGFVVKYGERYPSDACRVVLDLDMLVDLIREILV